MSGLLHRRLQHASSFGHNFANIPISRPDAPSKLAVQTKLTIGEPGDKYEQEADRVAAQVVNQINAPVSQQSSQNLQREEISEEAKQLQMKPMLQLRSAKVGMTAAPDLEASIKQARGGGQLLADSIREPMEQAIGADFSRVKVHTDSRANQLNRSLQARAFTTGHNVFFRQGEYNPGSRGGQELIAHELTHVVQQNGGAVSKKPLPQPQLSQHPATEAPSTSGLIQAMESSRGEEASSPVEAGETPIIVKKEGGKKAEFTIKGLINCVGVVIKVYEPGGFDHIAAVGGHFVTPKMYDTEKDTLTNDGMAFISKINTLIGKVDKKNLEAEFHVKASAVAGSKSTAMEEAKKAANAIKNELNIGGGIYQSSDEVHVVI
ncbi:hypothetical protein DP113_34170 (plasmid) [Brasilonema octagenarum UFV-E1]|uniref:eCIS core domain-containing protein n=3 Tax=Scytonemataceae TaxID=1182 RepID=A0A856MR92_9CYAN|nr:hypothetical protein [Brasilonema octagenarum UFV-OR1]QDL12864.1 hypothetical protein DP114_34060 [Brasilonema sennae CENA114]QDL19261.1 hypothetical protein DP113_34170 [Brasilonema octagenarum UFV-E1]